MLSPSSPVSAQLNSKDDEAATGVHLLSEDNDEKPAIRSHIAPPQPTEGHGEILRSNRTDRILALTADALLCLAITTFLVLAITAITLDGRPLSKFGDNVERWSLLSPTIFPLIFSAIVGRSLASMARRKLEDGSTLGTLEQLLGSQTVFGTIATQWLLRDLNILGVGLVLLWLISPLGGQATLRLLSHDQRVDVSTETLASYNWSSRTTIFHMPSQQLTDVVNSVYHSSLLTTTAIKHGPLDDWGNIKIPRFETYNHTLDSEGWAYIPERDVDWISLIGASIAGLNQSSDDEADFTFSTYYHDVTCGDMVKKPSESDWIEENIVAGNYNSSTLWGSDEFLSSWSLETSNVYWQGDTPDYNDPKRLDFYFLSKSGYVSSLEGPNYNDTCIALCSLTATMVDMQVQCQGRDCRVARMKRRDFPPPGQLGLVQELAKVWAFFKGPLTRADSRFAEMSSSVTENYIHGQTASPLQIEEFWGYLDMSEVSTSDFTQRLRVVIKTFFMSSLAPRASTGAMIEADAEKLLSGEVTIEAGYETTPVIPVEATVSRRVELYPCNRVFIALAVISCLVAHAVGTYGAYVKQRCCGPDTLGYFASVVRDSPYTRVPAGKSTQDSLTLARDLKSMVVRLEDVSDGTGHVGHIGVSSLDAMSVRTARKQVPDSRYY